MEEISLLPKQKPKEPVQFTKRKRPLHVNTSVSQIEKANLAYATPNGKYLAALLDREIQIWSLLSNQKVFQCSVTGWFPFNMKSMNGTSDSRSILFQGQEKIVVHWSCKLRQPIRNYFHDSVVQDIVTNNTSQFISNSRNYIYIWDLKSGDCLLKFSSKHIIYMILMQNYLYFNGWSADVSILNINAGLNQPKLQFDYIRTGGWLNMALSPCYKYFVQTSQYTDTIWIMDIKKELILKTIKGFEEPFHQVYFSIDGLYLVLQGPCKIVFYQLESLEEIFFIQKGMSLVTSCNRLLIGFIVEGKYSEWGESAIIFLKELHQQEEPGRQAKLRNKIKKEAREERIKKYGKKH